MMHRTSPFYSLRRWSGFVALLAALMLFAPAALAQDVTPSAASGLEAGRHVTYEQQVPINLVFVGYEQGDFKLNDLREWLPSSYAPVVRYPLFYGMAGRDMGLHFNFKYNVNWASTRFENDFFGYLESAGHTGPMTLYQAEYNNMASNVLDVTDPVLYIDAPSTEQWLMSNAGRLGVDTAKGYTIFFINWYSRPDFQFHVYTKTDEPDPDTGYNFGELRDSRKIIAWGGTHGRTWFYDLSAGPEAWTDNWAVDIPDLDGDGIEEYRMPAIWEYTAGGYRDPAALGQDLGLISRYVAINLLFTPSPLYDPLASSPGPEGRKVNHLEMFEADAGRRAVGTDYYDAALAGDLLADFQPYYDWYSVEELNRRPDEGARWALRIFGETNLRSGCWEDFGTPFAQMFCHFDQNYADYVPAYNEQDYVGTVFSYHVTQRRLGTQWGLLGFADDNWVDGTPSYLFVFGAKEYRDLGYGFTTTVVHEMGHHIGLSHPHDGYDSETGVDYGPGGSFYFAWAGDESDTTMQYLALSNTFGQFDRDNMNRYIFAGYLNWANDVLSRIEAHPDAASVQAHVDAADAAAWAAQKAFNQWDYASAAAGAREAWIHISLAAMALDIDTHVGVYARMTAPTGEPPREGDPIRFPNN